MSKTFMPELTPEERKRLLADNCDAQEQTTYYRELSPDDLDVKRESLSENLIHLSEWDDELQLAKDIFKSKAKPVKEDNKVLLSEIKTRKAMVTGTLFHVADHENGVMETFDENGEFVSSRRLRPDEKQLKAFPLKRAQ